MNSVDPTSSLLETSCHLGKYWGTPAKLNKLIRKMTPTSEAGDTFSKPFFFSTYKASYYELGMELFTPKNGRK